MKKFNRWLRHESVWGTAAVKVDDSRPSEPVAKRERLVTGCPVAEVHSVVSGVVGDKESTQSPPKEHEIFCRKQV